MHQKSYDQTPSIYIVPTPIGNMEDITIRAINTLKQVDIIFAEDTREAKKLLNNYQIQKPLISSHLYNEEKNKEKALKYLKENKNIAIISDRGTPTISDPGYTIIKHAINNNYNIITLPGPTAFTPALISSGLPTNHFLFYGFLNSKESKKKQELEQLKQLKETLIFYEAPHRINKTLKTIKLILGNRQSAIVREISKKHEEVIRGNIEYLIKETENIKGEIVIIIEGNKEEKTIEKQDITNQINNYIKQGKTKSEAIKQVSKENKISKNKIYEEYHKTKE